MPRHSNNRLRPHRTGYPSGDQEPYFSNTYGHGDPQRGGDSNSSPSSYEGDVGDDRNIDCYNANTGHHRDMRSIAGYPINNQVPSSASWDYTAHAGTAYPSPAPSQNDYDTWHGYMETDRRFSNHGPQGNNYQLNTSNTAAAPSHFSYQSDGYNPHGLQPYTGPWNDHRNDIARFNRDYKLRSTQFFSIGRVLSVYWAQPAGDTSVPHSSNNPYFFAAGLGQEVHANIRRMVVVRNQQGCSWCLAINTYGERGLLKPGIDLSTHAAVYMRGTEPAPIDPTRVPGIPPIMINPYSPREQLHSKSYLNFGKIFTVDHNIKVKPIGHVSEEFLGTFRRSWKRIVDQNDNDEYDTYNPHDGYIATSYH